MTAPKRRSAFELLLAQSSLLVSELKLLRTEVNAFDPLRGSKDERRLIEDRIYTLQSRAYLISDQLREMHEAFRAAKPDTTIKFGSLRLSKGD